MVKTIRQTLYPGWVFDHLLSSDQCRHYRKVIDRLVQQESTPDDPYFQDIIRLPVVAQDIWETIRTTLPRKVNHGRYTYKLVGLSNLVTVSRHHGDNIGIHRDKDVRIRKKELYCLYKLAIYLNDLSNPHDRYDTTGGTSFYDERKSWVWTAKPAEGRGVLFDMREWHSGAKVPHGKTKYMLGFRPMYRRIKSSSSRDKVCSECQSRHH